MQLGQVRSLVSSSAAARHSAQNAHNFTHCSVYVRKALSTDTLLAEVAVTLVTAAAAAEGSPNSPWKLKSERPMLTAI